MWRFQIKVPHLGDTRQRCHSDISSPGSQPPLQPSSTVSDPCSLWGADKQVGHFNNHINETHQHLPQALLFSVWFMIPHLLTARARHRKGVRGKGRSDWRRRSSGRGWCFEAWGRSLSRRRSLSPRSTNTGWVRRDRLPPTCTSKKQVDM